MEITIKLTKVNIIGANRLTDEQLRSHVMETVGDALTSEPLSEDAWIQAYTMDVDIKREPRT